MIEKTEKKDTSLALDERKLIKEEIQSRKENLLVR